MRASLGVCDHCWFVSLRLHNFSKRVSAVRRAADDRQNHPALVRRIGGGVEHLPAVFPSGLAGRLPVRAPLHAVSQAETTNRAAHWLDGA